MVTKATRLSSKFCKEYIKRKENYWFIKQYFGLEKFRDLWNLAAVDKEEELYHELNEIWFSLPDNVFNISVNPKGWSDFVNLLESYGENGN